jgi:enoyl-CoA hydratase/carnithine racemase
LLPRLMREADERDDVDVIILTGADRVLCAGLDLKELGSTAGNLGRTGADGARRPRRRCAAVPSRPEAADRRDQRRSRSRAGSSSR